MNSVSSSNEPRLRFGTYLRRLREELELTQLQAATRLAELTEGTAASWQSFLARAEQGKSSVSPEDLPLLSKSFEEPLERMVSAFCAALIFQAPMPKQLQSPSMKPDVTAASPDFFLSNAVEIWSLAEIAAWEASIPDRFRETNPQELWIIAPEFVDHRDSEFLRIVVDSLLMRQVNLTYFIAQRDIGPGEKFDLFLERVVSRLQLVLKARNERLADAKIGCISVFGLTSDDLAWFTSSLVIANPNEIEAGVPGIHAFMIVPAAGRHVFGIPVELDQLVTIVSVIKRQIGTRRLDQKDGSDKARYDVDALRKSNAFRRELDHD